ncbi:MAG: hypothetical protein Q7S36_01810 [Candidatus Liptonbacteria bacterium]|nr:hypothetical protein [Candidatus Liptonbacteria bacterium]
MGKKKTLHVTRYKFCGSRGQTALSLVFLIGGVALLISVTMTLVAMSFLNSTLSFQASNRAMALALSGAEDALLRLDRDPTFNSTSTGYIVPIGCAVGCSNVIVTRDSPVVGQTTIDSTATILASRRKIRAVASIDQNTGLVSLVSMMIQTL